MTTKPILDPCCGGKMFYFQKQNPAVLYCDNRELIALKNSRGRTLEIKPDIILDFRDLPFDDETFWHVVFDPPHLTDAGETSWMVRCYGKLPKDWQSYIKAGFDECWRVLKTNGTLVFKWSAHNIQPSEVIKVIGRQPLYGQRVAKGTHWMCFVKLQESEEVTNT
ncbi:MAG: class I SAM-dependent methyltransferase [Clostridiales bacterium]|nr:class I SAM-dependent methyltransferase [Clostridiales bacterium]